MPECLLAITFWRSPKILEARRTDERCISEAILWINLKRLTELLRDVGGIRGSTFGICPRKNIAERRGHTDSESEKMNVTVSMIGKWSQGLRSESSSLFLIDVVREASSLQRSSE